MRFDYKNLQLELLESGCPEEMSMQALIRWTRLIRGMLAWSLENPENEIAKRLLPISIAQVARTGRVCQALANPVEEELSAYDRMSCIDLASLLEECYVLLDVDEQSRQSVPEFVNDDLLQRLQAML